MHNKDNHGRDNEAAEVVVIITDINNSNINSDNNVDNGTDDIDNIDSTDFDFDACIALQLQREKEFLAVLCTPLLQVQLPVGVTEEIIAELALHLRDKVQYDLYF